VIAPSEVTVINIISTCANSTRGAGPYKVFANLVKGLDKIGYPYVINRDLNARRRLWIHDDVTALRYTNYSRAFKVVGPNLFVMPRDIPPEIDLHGALYLHPSEWAKRVWERVGFDACPIEAWPVGIDTEMFRPSVRKPSAPRVMVYHKKRNPQELSHVFEVLHEMGLPYTLLIYGEYHESEYVEVLKETTFIIWHGCHESQGIALLEALACDVPVLVCDATRLSQARGSYPFDELVKDFPVTSAPYFDDTCGVKITDLSDLKSSLEFMLDNLDGFASREYVLRNLSLEKRARAFVALWERWGLTFEQGLAETARTNRVWSIPLSVRVRAKAGRLVKALLPR
jgi:glycosyltransferase involved in cell wall biosynthesis